MEDVCGGSRGHVHGVSGDTDTFFCGTLYDAINAVNDVKASVQGGVPTPAPRLDSSQPDLRLGRLIRSAAEILQQSQ